MIIFLLDKRNNEVEFFPCALKKYKEIISDFRSENLSLHQIIMRCGDANLTGAQLIHTFERCKAIKDNRENPTPNEAKNPTPNEGLSTAKRYDLKRQRLIRRNFFESVDKAAAPQRRRPHLRDSAASAERINAGKLALNNADISI